MSVALGGGCALESHGEESIARQRVAITNGTPDDADDAVVGLVFDGAVGCSGVLVSSRVVVTAAHCVTPLAPDAIAIGRSVDREGGGAAIRIPVEATNAHPDFDPSTLANDIATVALASDATVAPAVMGATPGPSAQVRIVGFAPADAAGLPARRQGSAAVRAVDPDAFELQPDPSLPCGGDSGGAALLRDPASETLVGVISRGDESCVDHAWATRLDTHSAFVIAALASAPAPQHASTSCALAARPIGPSRATALWFGALAGLSLCRRIHRTRLRKPENGGQP